MQKLNSASFVEHVAANFTPALKTRVSASLIQFHEFVKGARNQFSAISQLVSSGGCGFGPFFLLSRRRACAKLPLFLYSVFLFFSPPSMRHTTFLSIFDFLLYIFFSFSSMLHTTYLFLSLSCFFLVSLHD